MKRIIRLNAVENICPQGILGMNHHSLHSEEGLFPQQRTIYGVILASLILTSLNKLNISNRNSLFGLQTTLRNIGFLVVLLWGLLNKSWNLLSYLVLLVSFIFGMGEGAKKIESVRWFSKELKQWLLRACNWIKYEFCSHLYSLNPVLQMSPVILDASSSRDKTAFYNKLAVFVINLPYQLLAIFNREDKAQTLVSLSLG
ncbi:MAG: hypothetical protein MJK14_03500 [Rivularia sp. ALOHA_DT_140]|nr:hypothetical protein [Rivularia sp. ALOHA_DT_140]